MVKYGKIYRKIQTPEWSKYYINYKLLKIKIKEIRNKLGNVIRNSARTSRTSLLSSPLIPEEDIENENNALYKEENGIYLKEFIDLLIREFYRSYNFYIQIEKVLIKKMNAHLCTQTSYSNYNLQELSKEMKSLSLTIFLTKSLNDFINDIMTAMKKILKKFDKNFSRVFGIITPLFVLKLLSKKNSGLDYMLQFKIIDEICIMGESSAKELKKYFDQNTEENTLENTVYRNTFMEKYNETLKYVKSIDEIIYFKTQHKDWVDYVIADKNKRINIKNLENDIFNPILSSSYDKDNQLDKFLSTKQAFDDLKNIQKTLSKVNKRNIILILTHSFFYNSLVTCIFPVLYYYEYLCGGYKQFYLMSFLVFTVIAVLYFAQYLSVLILYECVSIKKIKFTYSISYILFLCGSLIYIFSILYSIEDEHFKMRAVMLGASRFLIGLGSNQIQGKRYITLYTPKYYLPFLSKIYLLVEFAGFILGPCFTILMSFISSDKAWCLFNCTWYYGAIVSVLMIVINQIYFLSPKDNRFSTVIDKNLHLDTNASNSQVNQVSIEDDDSQDREFYRLQKEAEEKKKAGLEPTRSDDISIEVSDKEVKNLITTTKDDKEAPNQKEKEDDDLIYNKIIEEDKDNEERKGMTENYFSNVDIGRYSDMDVTKEEIETIKDIENKLFEYQEKSNFTNVNMMPRILDDIILSEQKTFGYVNRNYVKILGLLFVNSLIKENLIIFTSYEILFSYHNLKDKFAEEKDRKTVLQYSQDEKGEIQIICLLISAELLLQVISMLFIMPFFRINIIFKKHLMISMIASIILMIPLSFHLPLGVYIPTVSIDICLHKIIEVLCSCYLVYLIPPKWKYAHVRASSLVVHVMTFAKIFACLLCFSCFSEEEKVQIKTNMYILTVIASSIYGLIFGIIYKSKNFRVKALIRILKKRVDE